MVLFQRHAAIAYHYCSVVPASLVDSFGSSKPALAGVACRQMLLMPVESEVAAFSGSADTGAKKAAAVLVIQEAYRMYRHRQLVKVCMPVPVFSSSFAAILRVWALVAMLDVTAKLVQ